MLILLKFSKCKNMQDAGEIILAKNNKQKNARACFYREGASVVQRLEVECVNNVATCCGTVIINCDVR